MRLEEFNAGTVEEIRPSLLACCDVTRWADALLAVRPFASIEEVADAADKQARTLTGDDVARALAAHPRIGERAAGKGTEAGWSRDEQSGVSQDDATAAALAQANRDYEAKYGRVFLICATGLSAEQMLAAARTRLEHDETTEAQVVAEELRKIAVLRVRKLIAG